MTGVTNAELASALQQVIANVDAREDQLIAWQAGPFDGGPYGDGRYAITDLLGTVDYFKSPSRLEYEVGLLTTAGTGAVATALAAQAAAEAALASATTQATNAAASASTATTQASQAQVFRDEAANSEANALAHRNAAAASAAATGADAAASNAARVAAEAARDSAVTAEGVTLGYRNEALTARDQAQSYAASINPATLVTTVALQAELDSLVGAAPGALDTLHELATALGNDPNFATTVTNELANKAPLVHTHPYLPLTGGTVSGAAKFQSTFRLQNITGTSSHMESWISFRDGSDIERGLVGFGYYDTHLSLVNWMAGDVKITASGGNVLVNGRNILSELDGKEPAITTLPVSKGGTGATSLTSGYVLKGNGTSAVSSSVIYDNGTNVGVGTTAPNAALTIARGTGSDATITLRGNGLTEANEFVLSQDTVGADAYVWNRAAGGLLFGTGNTERMSISPAGVVAVNGNNLTVNGRNVLNDIDGKAASSHTHTTADIANLSSYTGFDARYYTESEADGRFYRYLGEMGSAVNLDNLQTTGRWHQASNAESNGTGYPTARAGLLQVFGDGYKYQTYQTYDGNDFYFRTYYQSWSSWKRLLHSENYNSFSPTLTGGGASGTWGISITGSSASTTGNAATATKLATARNIALTGDVTGSVSFDGSANVSITATVADDSHNHIIANIDGLQTALDGKLSTSGTAYDSTRLGGIGWERTLQKRRTRIHPSDSTSLDSSIQYPEMGFTYGGSGEPTGPYIAFGGLGGNIDYSCQLVGAYSGGGNDFKIRTRNDDQALWNPWRTILTDGNYTSYVPTKTGGGASGTWGISITGSSASTTGNASTATALQTARTLTIGNTGKSFNGSANVSWSLAEIGAAAASHSHAIANVTGLQAALDGKAAASHTHTSGNISDFAEAVDDRVAALLQSGTGISLSYDDASNTLTISQAGGAPLTISDFTGTNQSLGISGYQKLPGGLIIQWGSSSVAGNSTVYATLPTSFPTWHAACGFGFNGGTADSDDSTAYPWSTTQIKLTNGTSGTNTFRWFAIGY